MFYTFLLFFHMFFFSGGLLLLLCMAILAPSSFQYSNVGISPTRVTTLWMICDEIFSSRLYPDGKIFASNGKRVYCLN